MEVLHVVVQILLPNLFTTNVTLDGQHLRVLLRLFGCVGELVLLESLEAEAGVVALLAVKHVGLHVDLVLGETLGGVPTLNKSE